MKTYNVNFDFCSYLGETVTVYASNKKEVRQIMKAQYGSRVKINFIEESR